MTAQLACCPPWRAVDTWPFVAGWVRTAIERAKNGDFAQIERDVCAGLDHLWIGLVDGKARGVVVTGLREAEGRRVCVVLAFGGPGLMRHVKHLRTVERWAKSEGCAAVRIYGRRGWRRVLRAYAPIANGGIERTL
jgi:hypothetical protein